MNDLTIQDLASLLTEFGERLTDRDIEGEIYIAGGVAMLLAFHRAGFPREIDEVFVSQAEIDREVSAMAADHKDLESDWLNARVLPMLPRGIDADQLQVMGGPGLTVNVASAKWLLAMKTRAARGRRDLDDLWVLCQVLNLRSVDEVTAICDEVWGEGMLREDVIELFTSYLRSRGLN